MIDQRCRPRVARRAHNEREPARLRRAQGLSIVVSASEVAQIESSGVASVPKNARANRNKTVLHPAFGGGAWPHSVLPSNRPVRRFRASGAERLEEGFEELLPGAYGKGTMVISQTLPTSSTAPAYHTMSDHVWPCLVDINDPTPGLTSSALSLSLSL